MKQSIEKTVRFVALSLIERVEKGGAYSNLLIKEEIERNQLNEKDARLLTELVYGTISNQIRLDFYLAPFLKKAKKVHPWVQQLLRLSVYQMEFLDKIPTHAIFNEAVEIAKHRGNPGIGKFVNGVLRTFQRQGAPTLETLQEDERLSVEFSLPMWFVKRLVAQIGHTQTQLLGESLMRPSHVSARVDTRQISRKKAIDFLHEEELEVRESYLSKYGVVAEKGFLAKSNLFKSGKMTIQDESSMLVAPVMQIQPEHHVLDACAAPGGKTTHIATFLDQEKGGRVTALDIHAHKVKLIEENAIRLHVEEVVWAEKMDAREAGEQFASETFDRILVDAPCSGLGLIRRKPDIKFSKTEKDFANLPKIQLAILESVAPTLKSEGLLVYSTCTILDQENNEVVDAFLAKHPEFEKVTPEVNHYVQSAIKEDVLTIYPHTFHTDGFFISCLRKK